MKEFKQKRQFRKRIYSKLTLFILFLIFVFLADGAWGVFQKSKQSNDKLIVAQKEYDVYKQKHDDLSERISLLNTEAGVENEIRTKYNFAKEGEEAIIIVDAKKESGGPLEDEKPKGIWYIIKSWFTD